MGITQCIQVRRAGSSKHDSCPCSSSRLQARACGQRAAAGPRPRSDETLSVWIHRSAHRLAMLISYMHICKRSLSNVAHHHAYLSNTYPLPPCASFPPCLPFISSASLCPSYGRSSSERGVARPEVLTSLLASCDRVVQTVDSVEYGLTDIQVCGV